MERTHLLNILNPDIPGWLQECCKEKLRKRGGQKINMEHCCESSMGSWYAPVCLCRHVLCPCAVAQWDVCHENRMTRLECRGKNPMAGLSDGF